MIIITLTSGIINNNLITYIYNLVIILNTRMNTTELQKIIRAAELVNSKLDVNEVLNNIVNVAVELTNSDRGTLYLIDKEKNELWSLIALGTEPQEIRLNIGEGLAGYVAATGEILNIVDAQKDSRFKPDFDKLFGYKTNSVICFPIKSNINEIIGVLQLLNHHNGCFTKQDEDFLMALSIHSAIAINNALMHQKQIEINKELAIAKQEAEKSALLKTHFLAQMSHEIRTPLNIILSSTQLLKLHFSPILDEDTNELFEMLENGNYRILRTIEEIIQLSTINSGNYDLHFEAFVLKEDVLLQVIKNFEKIANQKGLQIIFNVNNDTGIITRDKFMIFQIFQEIVDNAIKFTSTGSIEIMEYFNDDKKLAVSIKDTGIGISDDFLERMFEPFTQEYTGYSRKFEGNGLALALVKKYAELNNLSISVKSKKNIGTEFIIVFN
jgi:signal transduction histidine kinase